LFIGVSPEDVRAWFRHDLDPALVADLEELCRAIRPGPGPARDAGIDRTIEAAIVERLAKAAPVRRIRVGPAFRFPGDVSDDPRHPTGDGGAATDERGAALPASDRGFVVVRVTGDTASVLEPLFEDWLEDVDASLPFVAVLE